MRRWEGTIQMDYGIIGFVDWIHLADNMDKWLSLVNMIVNLRVP
jgi:hypothetical protein